MGSLVQLRRAPSSEATPPQPRPFEARPLRRGAHGRAATLLLELPFKDVQNPGLGVSMLKAALEEAGYPCAIRYANLEFAALIGGGSIA